MEEAGQSLPAVVVESFVGESEQVLRIRLEVVVFSSAASEGLFLARGDASGPDNRLVSQTMWNGSATWTAWGGAWFVGGPVGSGQVEGGPSYVSRHRGRLAQ